MAPPRAGGGYGYAVYAVRPPVEGWRLRYDWTDVPGGGNQKNGGLVLLQYQPSEFSTLSVQFRHVHEDAGDLDHDAAFFKWTFNIGPHGAHPY